MLTNLTPAFINHQVGQRGNRETESLGHGAYSRWWYLVSFFIHWQTSSDWTQWRHWHTSVTDTNPLSRAAEQPETEGGGIPVTAEEMSELMYKPVSGEWGERSRDEECERIMSGIDQLITVGGSTHTHTSETTKLCFCVRFFFKMKYNPLTWCDFSQFHLNLVTVNVNCLIFFDRNCCSILWSRGPGPVSHLLHCHRLSHRPGNHQTATLAQILQVRIWPFFFFFFSFSFSLLYYRKSDFLINLWSSTDASQH